MEQVDAEVIRSIYKCIIDDSTAEFKRLLAYNPKVLNIPFYTIKENIFHYCAGKGKLDLCKIIFNLGISIDFSLTNLETPLNSAATSNYLNVVNWLLENGANIDALETSVTTPLIDAVVPGNIEIVKVLIDRGANVNRLHLRTNKTALDLAIIGGHKDIESILRSKGAVSTTEDYNWENEFGGSIIQYVNDLVGKVLPIELIQIVGENDISQRIAIGNKGKNKILFTVGLFAIHKPMLELFILLPIEWNMNDKSDKNQFPAMLLLYVANQIQSGMQINEGDYILSENENYKDLAWPEVIAGFCVIDHSWGNNDQTEDEELPKDEIVNLFTLVPVKKTKNGFTRQPVEKYKSMAWGQLALKI